MLLLKAASECRRHETLQKRFMANVIAHLPRVYRWHSTVHQVYDLPGGSGPLLVGYSFILQYMRFGPAGVRHQ